MNRKLIYISVVSLLILIIILTGLFGKKEPDWTMSFSRYSKNPYGNILLYDFLKTVFPGKKVITVHDPAYTLLKDRNYRRHNYIFINNSCVFDETDAKALFGFVSEGNNSFIAANMIWDMKSAGFTKRLGVETSAYAQYLKSTRIRFVNKNIGERAFDLRLEGGSFYFSKFDQRNTVILSVNEKNDPVFLRVKYGRGYFYLSSIPLAFTNYTVVSKQSDYPFIALSHLPVYDILWDEFYKIGRMEAETPLRFILNRTPLKSAYILIVIFVVLVIISGAKRKERPIPIIPPVLNTSLDFISTISSLYYRNRDHKNIAQKKINHFHEFIRSHFYMDSREKNEAFYERFAVKTGISREKIKKIFLKIESIQNKDKIKEHELMELEKNLDVIYIKTRSL